MDAREYVRRLREEFADRSDVTITESELRYDKGAYPFLRIASKEIGPDDRVLFVTAGFHGDEQAGPLTLLEHADEIVGDAHTSGLKIIIYPLINPSGFVAKTRYNIDDDKGEEGNNDFLRYELADGTAVSDLGLGKRFKSWKWTIDVTQRLPKETLLLAALLKQDPITQVAAIVDLHQDCYIRGPGAYHYAFGEHPRYRQITRKIDAVVPIVRDKEINSGYEFETQQRTDEDGFFIRHDGSIADLFFRLGAKHAITVETMSDTPMPAAMLVNQIWISGIIRLLRKD